MQKIKKVLSSIIGYAGSSENPQKMSLRFIGIVTAVISQFSPLISLLVSHFMTLPMGTTPEQFIANLSPLVEAFTLVTAVILYFIGMVRAGVQAYRTGGVGAFRV